MALAGACSILLLMTSLACTCHEAPAVAFTAHVQLATSFMNKNPKICMTCTMMPADGSSEGGSAADLGYPDPAHRDCAALQQLCHCPAEGACQICQAAGGLHML